MKDPVTKHHALATTGKFAKGGAVHDDVKADKALIKKMVKPIAKKCGGRVAKRKGGKV